MSYNQRQGNSYSNRNQQEWKSIPIQFKDDTYVSEAESVIKELKSKEFKVLRDTLTTSQIRQLLNLTSALYDEVQRSEMSQIMDRLAYLRVQFVYQSGRNEAVKKLVELADILKILQQIQENKDKALLVRFCRYMEALVAYFKFYGGRD